MELTGVIKSVLPSQMGVGSRGEWFKGFFVLEYTEGNFTQSLCLEVFGREKWEKMMQSIVAGNRVLVRFNVSSHEYNGKWFTSCSCYYCAVVSGGGSSSQQGDSQELPY